MGSNPTLGRYIYFNGDEVITSMATRYIGFRLKGCLDPRPCGCSGVILRSSQLSSMTGYPFKGYSGEECTDLLASLTKSLVTCSSVGRASDLQAGHGFESYTLGRSNHYVALPSTFL